MHGFRFTIYGIREDFYKSTFFFWDIYTFYLFLRSFSGRKIFDLIIWVGEANFDLNILFEALLGLLNGRKIILVLGLVSMLASLIPRTPDQRTRVLVGLHGFIFYLILIMYAKCSIRHCLISPQIMLILGIFWLLRRLIIAALITFEVPLLD